MLLSILFLCIGFMIAVLYIDLVFDMSALPYRHAQGPLPPAILDPIATYYRYITRNPYPLMFVMLTATTCVTVEIIYELVPRWAGYASLLIIGLNSLTAVLKVIPTAQRLASGGRTPEEQCRMVHSLLPYHVALLIGVLLLAAIQFSSTVL